jgi:hypothetical protein
MVAKTQILGELGERTVLTPALIEEGRAANDRLKIRLSLLQEAAAQASPGTEATLNGPRARLTDPIFNTAVSGARPIDADTFHAPGADPLGAGLNRTAKLAFGHPGLGSRRRSTVASLGDRRPETTSAPALSAPALSARTKGGEDRHRELASIVRPNGSLGYKPPAPKVFIPAIAARAASQLRPAAPPPLAQSQSMN